MIKSLTRQSSDMIYLCLQKIAIQIRVEPAIFRDTFYMPPDIRNSNCLTDRKARFRRGFLWRGDLALFSVRGRFGLFNHD